MCLILHMNKHRGSLYSLYRLYTRPRFIFLDFFYMVIVILMQNSITLDYSIDSECILGDDLHFSHTRCICIICASDHCVVHCLEGH